MKKRQFFYVFVAAVLLLRIGYYGGIYFPILDDYIQYGLYSTVGNPFAQVVLKFQDYTVRPLAVLTDVYVWARFWEHMGIAFIIITFMHGASSILIYEALNKAGIRCGLFFVLVYLLAPGRHGSNVLDFGVNAHYCSAVFCRCRSLVSDEKRRGLDDCSVAIQSAVLWILRANLHCEFFAVFHRGNQNEIQKMANCRNQRRCHCRLVCDVCSGRTNGKPRRYGAFLAGTDGENWALFL